MSRSYWELNGLEIKTEKVEELAPQEYKEFMGFIEKHNLDIDYFAKYLNGEDCLDVLFEEVDDEEMWDTLIGECEQKWDGLVAELSRVSGIELSLEYPSGDICSGGDRTYWTINNAFIRNPAIDASLFVSDNFYHVVCSG